jgi:predicted small integral membrane protein
MNFQASRVEMRCAFFSVTMIAPRNAGTIVFRRARDPARAMVGLSARSCEPRVFGGGTMLIIRIAKAVMVAAMALHASLVVFGKVTDYAINFSFVRNVMSMDTILPSSTIGYRAIKVPALHHAAYAMIMTAEFVMAVLCWIGAARLAGASRASGAAFNRAKPFAVAGLLTGLLIWQVGFITIGGEWFGMWMSQTWNGVPSAFRLVMIVLGTLIFVALPDSDLEPAVK